MADGIIKNVGYYETGIIVQNDIFTIDYVYWPSVRICIIAIHGNNNAPTEYQYEYSLPTKIYSYGYYPFPLRYDGENAEVRYNIIRINTMKKIWTSGFIVYPTV